MSTVEPSLWALLRSVITPTQINVILLLATTTITAVFPTVSENWTSFEQIDFTDGQTYHAWLGPYRYCDVYGECLWYDLNNYSDSTLQDRELNTVRALLVLVSFFAFTSLICTPFNYFKPAAVFGFIAWSCGLIASCLWFSYFQFLQSSYSSLPLQYRIVITLDYAFWLFVGGTACCIFANITLWAHVLRPSPNEVYHFTGLQGWPPHPAMHSSLSLFSTLLMLLNE